MKIQSLLNVIRDIVEVFVVVARDDYLLEIGLFCGYDFLLYAANREHPAGKSELSGHRQPLPDLFLRRH
jgi:predicted nucleic acid-binding Zn finger protein